MTHIYNNLRDIFGDLIGKTLVDITQHDGLERPTFMQLMFEDGSWLKFYIDDGFDSNVIPCTPPIRIEED